MTTKKTKTTKKTVTAKKATAKKATEKSPTRRAAPPSRTSRRVAPIKAPPSKTIDLETLQGLQSAVQELLKQSEKTSDQVAKLFSDLEDSLEALNDRASNLEWSYDIFLSRTGLDRVKDEEEEDPYSEEEDPCSSCDDDDDDEDEDEDY